MDKKKILAWIKGFFVRSSKEKDNRDEVGRELSSAVQESPRSEMPSPEKELPPSKAARKTIHRSIQGKLPDEKPSQSSVSKQPHQKSLKLKRHFNVGIDFGTSSTKVIYRSSEDRKSWVYSFGHRVKDYPPFILPSLIGVNGGELFFGAEVNRSHQDILFQSFKICMACQCASSESIECNLIYDPEIHSPPDPAFNLTIEEVGLVRLEPLMLGTFFLAYVIKSVKDDIIKEFGETYDVRITYNMCIPISYSEDFSSEIGFSKALFFAEKLSGQINENRKVTQLTELYRKLNEKYPEIPNEDIRRTFTKPESLSAVMSYAISRLADEGLYAIIDVGAGTTDCSIFRLGNFMGKKLAVYAADTYTIACDNIDNGILKWLVDNGHIDNLKDHQYRQGILQHLRIRKVDFVNKGIMQIKTSPKSVQIDTHLFESIAKTTVSKIFYNYQKTWSAAYAKEVGTSRWRDISLFLIGGGNQIHIIKKKISAKPADYVENINIRPIVPPEDLLAPTGLDQMVKSQFYLLSVAYGLSYNPLEWPKVYLPSAVPPLDYSTPGKKKIPDHEDKYTKR